jgi:uncharacterized protein with von Willebrand factor type A (vWA) domain
MTEKLTVNGRVNIDLNRLNISAKQFHKLDTSKKLLFTILLDNSGSMTGAKMKSALDAFKTIFDNVLM